MPLEDYAREFSGAAVDELLIGKVIGSKFTPVTKSDGFDGLRDYFKLQFLGDKVSHVRRYFSQDFGVWRCFLTCQVAVEDLGKVWPASSKWRLP